jgi:hypothetical protein
MAGAFPKGTHYPHRRAIDSVARVDWFSKAGVTSRFVTRNNPKSIDENRFRAYKIYDLVEIE